MLSDLDRIVQRYNKLQNELSRLEVSSDPAVAASLSKEMKDLQPLVEKIRQYHSAEREIAQAKELLTENDPDLDDQMEHASDQSADHT